MILSIRLIANMVIVGTIRDVSRVKGQNVGEDALVWLFDHVWMITNAASMWIFIETIKQYLITKMFQQIQKFVVPVWKRASSAMKGKLGAIHGVWFSATPLWPVSMSLSITPAHSLNKPAFFGLENGTR